MVIESLLIKQMKPAGVPSKLQLFIEFSISRQFGQSLNTLVLLILYSRRIVLGKNGYMGAVVGVRPPCGLLAASLEPYS